MSGPSAERAASGPAVPGACVLVVDDDPVIRRFVRAVLEPVGYRVEEAASGQDALACIDELRPGVVVLDVMMPDLTGVDVVRQVGGGTVKVLMLTAVDDPDVERESIEAGAVGYLTKPFSPGALLERIEELTAP